MIRIIIKTYETNNLQVRERLRVAMERIAMLEDELTTSTELNTDLKGELAKAIEELQQVRKEEREGRRRRKEAG